ncbi:MAG: GNAT family N-acetyltransferase [Armatimonadetes bacterium]|nr:GNAT family N-acetyltransferase [Armatimonadota bacterium]
MSATRPTAVLRLSTPRMELRTPCQGDAGEFAAYRVRNRQAHGWTEPPRQEEYFTAGYWHNALAPVPDRAKNDTEYRFAAFLKDDPDHLVGLVNLYNVMRGPIQCALLGYSVDAGHMGRGLASEAVSAVVSWAFGPADLMRLEANVLPENHASIRVLEKCGFHRVGLMRKSLRLAGGWQDHYMYETVNEHHRGDRP